MLDERPPDPFLTSREAVIARPSSTIEERLQAALQICGTRTGVPGIGNPHLMGYQGEHLGTMLASLLTECGWDLVRRDS